MNKNRKGFTIVELVIVIAIIAILAAVLIPTFASLIAKANVSVDTQLVRNLNNALAQEKAGGENNKTMYDALMMTKSAGYDIDTIVSKSGNNIAWDSKNDRFVLIDPNNNTYIYPNESGAGSQTIANPVDFFVIYNEVPAAQKYSIYLSKNATVTEANVTVGFDAGENTAVTALTYTGVGTAQNVVIRTNSGMLRVNAPLDTVNHYNSAQAVAIDSVADHSFHEFGKIDGEISIKEGHLILESGSSAMFVNINATTEAELAQISVTLESGSSYSYVTTANNDLISQVLAVVENKTGEETVKTLVKIDESAVAFIKDGDSVTEYSDIKLALNDFKTKEGATLELLDNIVNIEAASSKQLSITMPKNGTINGHGKMIYGNVAIYVNSAGGSIYNTQFKYIHNNSQANQGECDWYGWISKEGKLTAIYATKLEGKLVIDGCLFDNIDWDAIQTTPKSGATIEITNNVFMHSDKTAYSQLRYIHIQPSYNTPVTVVITDNEFYKTQNTSASAITNIGCWYARPSEDSDFTGNYFEYDSAEQKVDTNCEIDYVGITKLFPARSSANVNVDDLTPVSYIGDVAYFTLEATPLAYDSDNNTYATLQDAIDNCPKSYFTLAKDCSESVTIPEGKSLTIYATTYKVNGTITNNGTLTFSIDDYTVGTGKIINNGTLKIKYGSYDPNKITNGKNGTVIISGGTFTAQPQSDWIAEWYTVAQNENGSFTVRLMNDEEAIAAGAVARYGSATSTSRKYFKTLQEGVQNGAVHLLKDVTGESIEKTTSYVDLYCEEYTFTGSITCTGKTLYIDNGTAVLSMIDCGTFYAGYGSDKANVTVNDGTATNIKVAKNATLVINGGTYTGTITVTTGGTASLVINGGTFSVDPTVYVDTGTHTVIENADGTWTVSAK